MKAMALRAHASSVDLPFGGAMHDRSQVLRNAHTDLPGVLGDRFFDGVESFANESASDNARGGSETNHPISPGI